MRLDLLCEQVTLNTDHNILKIQNRYKTRTVFIAPPKTFNGVLFVEVVEELAEFVVRHQTLLGFAEIQLDERRIHVEGDASVQFGFLHHLHELGYNNTIII